jgi:hypothetical protein
MKAIVVKYFGPSNTKGSRLRVSAEGVPWPYALWLDERGASQNLGSLSSKEVEALR